MEIADKQSLSVLMTAMYIAKWESDDDNAHVTEIAGSPVFAQLYRDLVDAVIRLDADKPPAVRRWEAWRAIEQRPEQLDRTRARILSSSRLWATWSREQKQYWVACLLSPFTATAATLEELLAL